MAEGKTVRQRHLDGDAEVPRNGFAVVFETVVGFVDFDDAFTGMTAMQAAFSIIAEHGDEGRYRFPGPDENVDVVVEITYVTKSAGKNGEGLAG